MILNILYNFRWYSTFRAHIIKKGREHNEKKRCIGNDAYFTVCIRKGSSMCLSLDFKDSDLISKYLYLAHLSRLRPPRRVTPAFNVIKGIRHLQLVYF